MHRITFDAAKRARTLAERGLDFADAAIVFDGPTATVEDMRKDYGEARYQTMGLLAGRVVMVVWTPRKTSRRVISMRYVHDNEAQTFELD
ncbi:MAG: BrnT family toxin [Rhodanobacteraceae bacterium]